MAVAQLFFDLRAEMMQINDDIADAVTAQEQQSKLDHGPASHRHQRFRHTVGDRPQACALAGGEHHRFHSMASKCSRNSGRIGLVCATWARLRWSRRTVGGTNFI